VCFEPLVSGSPCVAIILTTASSDRLKESHTFLSGEGFPLSRDQSIKRYLHNTNTMQREHPIPQHLTHTPDLSIAPLGENNAEPCGTESINLAGFGRLVENDNSLGHAIDEHLIEWMIDRHLIFPFMSVLSS